MRNGALAATIASACTAALGSLLAASHSWIVEPTDAELCAGLSPVSDCGSSIFSISCPSSGYAEALKLETDADPIPRLQRTRVQSVHTSLAVPRSAVQSGFALRVSVMVGRRGLAISLGRQEDC